MHTYVQLYSMHTKIKIDNNNMHIYQVPVVMILHVPSYVYPGTFGTFYQQYVAILLIYECTEGSTTYMHTYMTSMTYIHECVHHVCIPSCRTGTSIF